MLAPAKEMRSDTPASSGTVLSAERGLKAERAPGPGGITVTLMVTYYRKLGQC